MTVSTTHYYVEHAGNGVNKTFIYDFKIFEDDNMIVYLTPTTGSGEAVVQSAYSVTDAGEEEGGTVVFNAEADAPTALETVRLERVLLPVQETDYVPNDPFPADAHEDALDYLTMLIQQAGIGSGSFGSISFDRCIIVPVGDTATNLQLPNAAGRADMYLTFDSNGDVTVTSQTDGTFDVTDWAKTLLDDTNATAGRTTMEMYTSTGRYSKSQTGVAVALTPGAATAWNCDTAQIASIELTADRGMANPTNMYAGGTYTLVITQDGTGSWNLTYGSAYKFEDATAPELSSGANEKTILFFWSDGTYMYGGTFWKEVS